MHPKDADGMANSIDPDQTASSEAVWSWSALFAETSLSQYIEFVRYFIVIPRSETPLIYKAVPSWFVRVEQAQELLLANNSQTYW